MSKEHKKSNEIKSAYDYSEILKKNTKAIRKVTLKRGGFYVFFYTIILVVIFILNRVSEINMSMREAYISVAFLGIFLVILLGINMRWMITNEKKLYARDKVDPELKNVSMECYRSILEERDTSRILAMYHELYTQDRRRINISQKTILGSLATIVVTSIVTYVTTEYKTFETNDILIFYFAILIMLPQILEILLIFLTIIEDDVISKKPVVEKYVQDCIVKELVREKLEINMSE